MGQGSDWSTAVDRSYIIDATSTFGDSVYRERSEMGVQRNGRDDINMIIHGDRESNAQSDTGDIPRSNTGQGDTGALPKSYTAQGDTGDLPKSNTAQGDTGDIPKSNTVQGDTGDKPKSNTAQGDTGDIPKSNTAQGNTGDIPKGNKSDAILATAHEAICLKKNTSAVSSVTRYGSRLTVSTEGGSSRHGS